MGSASTALSLTSFILLQSASRSLQVAALPWSRFPSPQAEIMSRPDSILRRAYADHYPADLMYVFDNASVHR